MTAQQLDLMARYRQLRQAGNELCLEIVQGIPKEIFDLGARRLGLLRNNFLVMDTPADEGILIDYCLYDVRPDGKNVVELALGRLSLSSSTEQSLFLDAMLRPHYSIFEVQGVQPGVGIQVSDHLFGGERFIVDEGLAASVSAGNAFCGRLLAVEDMTITTGAVMPLNARWLEVLGIVINQLAQEWQVRNLNETNEAQRSELTATIVYSALSFGATRGIQATKSPNHDDYTILGRKDACPCGSGQPFGVCCGKRG